MLNIGGPRVGLGVVLLAIGACSAETPRGSDRPTGGAAAPIIPMLPAAGVGGGMAPPVTGIGSGMAGMAALPLGGAGAGGSGGSPAAGGAGGMMVACTTGTLDSDLDGSVDCDDGCPMDLAKTAPGICGCGKTEPAMMGAACVDMPIEPEADLCVVAPITAELREIHGEVYTRYASARGAPVLATDSPSDESLRRACLLLRDLGQRPDILETMLQEDIGLVVMGVDETSADFPEFAAWGVPDSRARGLGGVPRGLCAEENVMCDRTVDRWRGESICVHEFAHTMHLGVYNVMESDFNSRVRAAYQAAISAGKYANTYAASNATEYFGEGVQDWYNTNIGLDRPNGVHNEINTRAELMEYDPGLYEILAEVLPDQPGYKDCYYYE